jgi:tetratricopeptide (TPR) repeat protein
MDTSPVVVAAHRCLGLLLLQLDEVSEGSHHIRRAVELVEDLPECLEFAPAHLALALLHQRSEDLAQALHHAGQALAAARSVEFTLQVHAVYAELLTAAGEAAEARTHAAAAARLAEVIDAPLMQRYTSRVLSLQGAAPVASRGMALTLDTHTRGAQPAVITLFRRS